MSLYSANANILKDKEEWVFSRHQSAHYIDLETPEAAGIDALGLPRSLLFPVGCYQLHQANEEAELDHINLLIFTSQDTATATG